MDNISEGENSIPLHVDSADKDEPITVVSAVNHLTDTESSKTSVYQQ